MEGTGSEGGHKKDRRRSRRKEKTCEQRASSIFTCTRISELQVSKVNYLWQQVFYRYNSSVQIRLTAVNDSLQTCKK
ncbi:hypothetical protein T11_4373 [Trichinella zimbabwensis]|uniref:Uncharacterized protein n=1 Tax=Trichinella zimbabwensis TaxID=268475 RepID=A0A0V1I3X3_9BILA|nr:hypothetical protein T11_4373 [Trichinella zimbabwensis]